ncbi:hypothetical protein SAMN05444392_10443 [Seinonella peptonophila]|uniref:Putative membrane protein insertion efficiency factor n=1 Tax=Seinonella peptonophila TaxID=112248 RepID=A0A1M4WZ34_9BACL|nr:membrane protein insertion efficiency factor YidD [Seinonella peptonophila]SHE86509.1 hypothetical protein SAMN05444392_10443 [Seinonella peptonophila]
MLKRFALGMIHIYRRYLSPLKPPVCRFYPTCSQYGLIAIERHGFWLGGWYTLKRIAKCHPFHPGGIDHVPQKEQKEEDPLC